MKRLVQIITIITCLQFLFVNCQSNQNTENHSTGIASIAIDTTEKQSMIPSQVRAFSSGNIDRTGMEFQWYQGSAAGYKIKGSESLSSKFDIKYGLIEDPFVKSYYVYRTEKSDSMNCDSIVRDQIGLYHLIKKPSVALSIVINTKYENRIQKIDTICFFKDMFADFIKKAYSPSKDSRFMDLQYDMINFDLFHLKLDSIISDTVYFNFGIGQNETCFSDFFTYKYWSSGDSIYYEDPYTYEDEEDSPWGTVNFADSVKHDDIFYMKKTINRYVTNDSSVAYDSNSLIKSFKSPWRVNK